MRENSMLRLAKEFGLKFNSKPPSFIDFYFKFLFTSPDWRINQINGIINGHQVEIYDNLFAGPKFLIGAMNYEKRFTVVKIDGEYLKGEYKSFKIGDSCLTSLVWLRKLLTTLMIPNKFKFKDLINSPRL